MLFTKWFPKNSYLWDISELIADSSMWPTSITNTLGYNDHSLNVLRNSNSYPSMSKTNKSSLSKLHFFTTSLKVIVLHFILLMMFGVCVFYSNLSNLSCLNDSCFHKTLYLESVFKYAVWCSSFNWYPIFII